MACSSSPRTMRGGSAARCCRSMAGSRPMTQNVLDYLAARHDEILAELVDFASIPSVSADPAHADDMGRSAAWVADQLRLAGMDGVAILPTSRHPVVYGEWLHAENAPTILIYGHYDVQPPDPLDKWQSTPFEPTVRDGRLYARGVSDDKGPMLIPIKVAQAFMAVEGSAAGQRQVHDRRRGGDRLAQPGAVHPGARGAAGCRLRALGRRGHVAHRRTVDHRLQPRHDRAGVHRDRRDQGSALGATWRRGGQSAARHGRDGGLSAHSRWPGGGGRFL